MLRMNDEPTQNEVVCYSCNGKWDEFNILEWKSIIIENKDIKITDYFCPICSKILYGYTKVEWK